MSFLSEKPDGMGCYYGFYPGDERRIDVRLEEKLYRVADETFIDSFYASYVGGELVGDLFIDKAQAEAAAIAYIIQDNEDKERSKTKDSCIKQIYVVFCKDANASAMKAFTSKKLAWKYYHEQSELYALDMELKTVKLCDCKP